tara:strand:+ start:2339 stop:3469 length:1131 start_codon:yes stop_codon:yes gene_type:complete
MDSTPLKFFLIAGEPSGDLHGGRLIKAIQRLEPNSSFMGHGGKFMQNAGMQLLEHSDDLTMMGFTEVVKHLPRMMHILRKTSNTIERTKPNRVILIDYPGFNLRLAKKIKKLNIPITYFILPQVWAWKEKRVKTMKSVLNQALSIFPFEHDWFKSKGLKIDYVGHPFADKEHFDESSKEFYQRHNLTIEHPLLVLLPGSRQQEIDRHWTIFLDTAKTLKQIHPNLQIMVGKSPHVNLSPLPNHFKIEKNSRKAIIAGTAALVSSGTATLECAVEDTPLVVCYKLSCISWFIAKNLTKIPFASIVNLIANKKIVPEYLQHNMTKDNLVKALLPLIDQNNEERKRMLTRFDTVRLTLGKPGVYNRAAEAILSKMMLDS